MKKLLKKQGELEPNMSVNKKSGINSKIHEENKLCTYPIWIKRKVQKEIATVGKEDNDENKSVGFDEFFKGLSSGKTNK